jgi:hypothetical protein
MIIKGLLAAMVLAGLLAGCATASLPANATIDQRNEALCKDAQMGWMLSQVMLKRPKVNAAENNYWIDYQAGVELARKTYCAGWIQ